MKIILKDESVSIKDLHPKMILALPDIKSVFDFFGVDTVVTSGREETVKHMPGSLHYKRKALDFRSRRINLQYRETAARMLQFKLGRDYDVVLEKTHIHVEYDPPKSSS